MTRRLTEDVEERLQSEFDVLFCGDRTACRAAEIEVHVGAVDAICPTVADRIDGKVLQHAGSRLRMIANFGVGYNNVDVPRARDLGVVVTNTPDVLTESTADLAMTSGRFFRRPGTTRSRGVRFSGTGQPGYAEQ
jgi:glyoxylate reductase